MQRRLFLLVLIFSTALLGQPQQQAQQTGSIEGSIVKFGTTDPIARAKVTLRPSNSPNSQAVTADDGGKFTFRDLTSGQYRITVTREGYVAGEYGQRSPGSSGVPINLGAQQQFKDARISLTPTGTISGRIVNRYGEPAGNVNVQALRYTYQDGKRSLTPMQNIRTNDLGEYRLFWMQPGQYIVSAQGNDSIVVDPGGTIFFQGGRGGAGILGPGGPQLGVGGVTRITVTGAGPGPTGDFGGGGFAPPPPPPPPPPGATVTDDSNVSLPVYFPGTLDVSAATPVDLRAGGNVGGVNLTIVDAKPVRIRGQVLNGGRPASGAQVSLYLRNNTSGSLTVRSAPVNNDTGAFEFRNVAPGAYELVASLNGFGPSAVIMNSPLGNAAGVNAVTAGVGRGGRVPGAPVLGARSQVDVNNTDVEGVSLLLETGFNVNGRVTIEGQSANSPANLASVRLQLQADPAIPPLAIPGVNPQADGTFSIEGVTPGTYTLSVAALVPNTYLKSARLGGVDVLSGLRIDNTPNGPLDIVLGSAPGSLDATAVDDRQMPVPAVIVAIVPAAAAQEKRFALYRSATTDSSGRIHLDGVVPGDYKIYAWESVENGAWTDPNFMRAYQTNGTAIRVTEGGRAAADVRVIPYR